MDRALFGPHSFSFTKKAIALLLVILSLFTAIRTEAASPDAQRGETVYKANCAGCHSIGGGKLVGPDLKDVAARRPADWLVQYIYAPDKVKASGDPVGKQLAQEFGMSMPNMGISQDDAVAIAAYLTALSGEKAQQTDAPAAKPVAAPAGNPANGKTLFTGEKALKNGGSPCIACHNADSVGGFGGGSLAISLTKVSTKYGSALGTSMKAAAFPLMKEAYSTHPITEEEAADLAAFFLDLSNQPASPSFDTGFLLAGAGGFILILGLMQLVWRNRLTGVRKQITGGLLK